MATFFRIFFSTFVRIHKKKVESRICLSNTKWTFRCLYRSQKFIVLLQKSLAAYAVEMLRIPLSLTKIARQSPRHFSTVKMFVENQTQLCDNRANRYTINYSRCGDGKNAIVLIPGALGTAATDFQPQLEQLPKLLPNHSIVSFDPPGY